MADEPSSFDKDLVRAQVRARLFGARDEASIRIGRYRVLRRIGAGAMGVVYAAHDPHLDRNIALKIGKSHQTTERQMARAVREAQALARLAHPNVVTVFDVGVHDGRLYVAMELIDGAPLPEWTKAAKRSWREIVRVLISAGRALAAAHASGLIHRDFKPDNVLVTRDGRAKVLDFGLVRAVRLSDQAHTEDVRARPLEVRLTESLAVIGTPAYMAPEQLEGREVDPRADQYAFCAVLYEALFGRLPHPAESISQLLESALERPPRPIPAGTDVPSPVQEAILRGLSRDPDRRHPSMDALVDMLSAVVEAPRSRTGLAGIGAMVAATGCALVGLAGLVAGLVVLAEPWATTDAPSIESQPSVLPIRTDAQSGRDASASQPDEMLVAGVDGGPSDTADAAREAPDAGSRRRWRPRVPARPRPGPISTAPESAEDEELETGFFVRDVVRRCWRAHLESHPDARATPVTLVLRVDAGGVVDHISADSMADVPDLLACIETRGRDWQGFPRHTRERRATRLVLLRAPAP